MIRKGSSLQFRGYTILIAVGVLLFILAGLFIYERWHIDDDSKFLSCMISALGLGLAGAGLLIRKDTLVASRKMEKHGHTDPT
jgi:hypothetical protein